MNRYEIALDLACNELELDVGDNYYDQDGKNQQSSWKERFLKEADERLNNMN